MASPQASTTAAAPVDAIILAAGKGKRMNSDLPKVVHPACGKPMVWWVVQACREAGVSRCILVVGHGAEHVKQAVADQPGCLFVEQREQLGTGHATMMAEPLFTGSGHDVFVLAGDGPLIRPQTLRKLLEVHRTQHAAATMATAVIDDPSGYGRVVRAADGSFGQIVEQKDCTPAQLALREVNPSYYCFRSDLLFAGLKRVDRNNSQGEYYLTDVPALLKADGRTVAVVDAVPPQDVLSVNTPQQLSEVDRILRDRHSSRHAGSIR